MKKLILFLTPFLTVAQTTISLNGTIKENIVNANTGMLLVRTSESLYGIHPATKEITWENSDLEKVSFNAYQEIPFTPLVAFEKTPVVNSKLLTSTVNAKGTGKTIVNSITGTILFDSQKLGFTSVNKTLFLPELQGILADGILNKEPAVALYDYANQRFIWKSNLTQSSFLESLRGTLFEREKILIDANKNVFWLRNTILLHLNGNKGTLLFEQEGVTSIALHPNKEILYVLTKAPEAEKLKRRTSVMAFSVKDMKPLWEKAVAYQGAFKAVAFEGDDLLLLTSAGFTFINREGIPSWEYSESLPLIKKIVPVQEGFLVVQERFLTLINPDGSRAWEKPLKISLSNDEQPVYLFEETEEVLYVTPSLSNKVRIASGEKVWEDLELNEADFLSRNLKLKVPLIRIWKDSLRNQFAAFSNNKLYLLNHSLEKAPSPVQTFDFGRKLPQVSVRDFGFFISHNNQFYGLNEQGNLLYEKSYAPTINPSVFGETLYYLKRGLNSYRAATSFVYNQAFQTAGSTLASGNLGMLTAIGSGIYGSYQLYQNPSSVIANAEALELQSGLESVLKRIKKGKEGKDIKLVVTPLDKETHQIIELHIPTGEDKVLKELKEKKFVLDEIERLLYTFEKNTLQIENLR